jgi:hypothetical protein
MSTADFNEIISDIAKTVQGAINGLQVVATAVSEFIRRLDTPALRAFAKFVNQYPEGLRDKVRMQRGLLRRGLVPSNVIMALATKQVELKAHEVALAYAASFRKRGSHRFAEVMETLAEVAALGHHRMTLGATFPEVEGIARSHIYEPGTGFKITSLPSVRLSVSQLLVGGTLMDSVSAIDLDHFIFTLIDAVDFAYLDDSKPDQFLSMKRHGRAFRYVSNRHHVSHGTDATYEERHVINAFSVLYTVMTIAEHMMREGLTAPAEWPNGRVELIRYKAERRKFNLLFLTIAYANRTQPDQASELPSSPAN